MLLCRPEAGDSGVVRKLATLGLTDIIPEVLTALAEVIDGTVGSCALVLDCDSQPLGGIGGGRRAVAMLGDALGRIAVILLSKDYSRPILPLDRRAPVELPAPASVLSLQAGFEHALRQRLACLAA